jgi:hypothetical protein
MGAGMITAIMCVVAFYAGVMAEAIDRRLHAKWPVSLFCVIVLIVAWGILDHYGW